MKKLINGILDFQQNKQKEYCEKYAQLALGQKPDALLVACSDSRVVPNIFASTDPGDMFVVRNVGNLIPPCCVNSDHEPTFSEAAAIDFSLLALNVKDIIVCGHSECGAMQAQLNNSPNLPQNLKKWLYYGDEIRSENHGFEANSDLSPHNQLSQYNVLKQLAHLKTYPEVHQRLARGELRLHAWWFDIATANVHCYLESENDFTLINESIAEKLLTTL
ncbi:MAG: hypothetical protein KDD40_08310 [Bdellovibrionales bacterium]|nr:hypothetical protein [Bdellovibrionales bacterium]